RGRGGAAPDGRACIGGYVGRRGARSGGGHARPGPARAGTARRGPAACCQCLPHQGRDAARAREGEALQLTAHGIFTLPCRLGDSRILALSGKGISFERGGETVPAVAHGLWSRWFVVAIPSTEPCRDPGDEGERAWGVRIFLTQRFALELFRQTFESGG